MKVLACGVVRSGAYDHLLSGSKSNSIEQSSHDCPFAVFETRSNFGNRDIVVPELSVAVLYGTDCPRVFKPDCSIVSDSLHRQKGDRQLTVEVTHLSLRRI